MEMDNDFWRYSLLIYRQAEVESLCLRLQDEFDMDVNLVLFCHWLGAAGLEATSKQLEDLVDYIEDWRYQVVLPLRSLRRGLSTGVDVDLVKEHIETAELAAEQYQQALMWGYYEDHKDSFTETGSIWYESLLKGQPVRHLSVCKELLSKFPVRV